MTERKKTKLFGIFNILDLIILLFAVAAGAALFWRLDIVDSVTSGAGEVGIEFQIKVEPVRIMAYLAIDEGEILYDGENGQPLGTITKIETTPYMRQVVMADGSITLAEDPENFTIYITCEGVGSSTPEGIMLGGSRIASPGGSVKVTAEKLDTSGIFVMSKVLN